MKTEYYISVVEFLMGRDEKYPPTPEMVMNYNELIPKINQLLECFYTDNPEATRRPCNSGYRPAEINANVPGSAKKSNHMICAAIDLGDDDQLLGNWCMNNFDKVKGLGLFMESLDTTHAKPSKWVHLQCKAVKSGSNPFHP